jgi:hypothetical protein
MIMHKKLVTIVFIVVFFLGIFVFLFVNKDNYFPHKEIKEVKVTKVVTATSSVARVSVQVPGPAKTSFGQKLPNGFPTSIPVPQGIDLSQSYSLDYSNASSSKSQLTVVFGSKKTVKENYNSYSAFLKKDGWNIVSVNASTTISSLYATKSNFATKSKQDINITISQESNFSTTTVSLVSVTVFNK